MFVHYSLFPTSQPRLEWQQVRSTYADPVKGMLLAAVPAAQDDSQVIFSRRQPCSSVVTTQLMRKGLRSTPSSGLQNETFSSWITRVRCVVAIVMGANSVMHAICASLLSRIFS
jgi:hypothetical protein